MKKIFTLLLIMFLSNCITNTYKKKYAPESMDNLKHEFRDGELVYAGQQSLDEQGKEVFYFSGPLRGDGRVLKITPIPGEKKVLFEETDKKPEFISENAFLVIRKKPIKLFNSEDRLVDFSETGISNELIQSEEISLLGIADLGFSEYFDVYFVKLNKGDAGPTTYSKKFPPKKLRIDSQRVEWKERNRIKWVASWTVFYAGYIITVPLDIVTGIFQIGFYFYAGGAVK